MRSPKNPLSVWRYFKAGLKPFGRFSFWGPPSIFAVLALCFWQYSKHPEWLNTDFEQPDGVANMLGNNPNNASNPDIGLEMPLQSLSQEAQRQEEQLRLTNPLNNANINSNGDRMPGLETQKGMDKTTATANTDVLSRLTGKPAEQAKKEPESPQIFMPLVPNLNNSSAPTAPNTNSQKQNNQNPSISQIQPSSLDVLTKPKSTTLPNNALQDAMNQRSSTGAGSTSAATTSAAQQDFTERNRVNPLSQPQPTSNNFSNQPTVSQPPTQPYQPYYNNTPTQGNMGLPGLSSSSMQSSQYYDPSFNPYRNTPVQTPNLTQQAQQPSQPYQSPYLNNPVQTNPAQSSTPNSSAAPNYPSPYLNSPVQQTPPVTQNQLRQPNYSTNVVPPQYQRNY
ncbi:hypothetical protein NIES593_13010 [Hydrococcus rivularis NIES-593]|uniref:Uncharacterized protein n=1 Tax=Hydrococcus rivularis NIES-593 TaxID=1921803 RepID=A0A1U7HFN1_9CYAN|nr:hypothetical protein [Hydrococcus rivularis]OKH22386.1 hypothetical protein NIES593_13010 [Hydrococcus rivularis NIES-593]